MAEGLRVQGFRVLGLGLMGFRVSGVGRGKLVPSNNGFLSPNSFEASPWVFFRVFVWT